MMSKLKEFVEECKRVLTITKKPDSKEFKTIFLVSIIGVLLIGSIGFLISIIWQIFSN